MSTVAKVFENNAEIEKLEAQIEALKNASSALLKGVVETTGKNVSHDGVDYVISVRGDYYFLKRERAKKAK